ATPVRIRATDARVTGLDGPDGDEVIAFTAGRGTLAGRLVLDADPSLAEVRLIAETGDGLTGVSALIALRPAGPRLLPLADYRDRNQSRTVDAGDALTLSFDEPVDATIAEPSPYGTVVAGPEEHQVTITLAAGVALPAVVTVEGAGSAEVVGFPADTGVRLGTGTHTEDVAVIDVNQDGILDLAFANAYESQYFLGAADGFSSNRYGSIGLTAAGTCIDSGDFNGDGWPDLVIGAYTRGMVFLNARNGSFARVQSFECGALVTDVEVGDLDGDGEDDIVVATRGSNSAWFNDGAGVFTRRQTFDSYYTEDIALVDIDADGDLDSIHANVVLVNLLEPDAPNRIWLNDGAGRFSLKADFGPLDRTWAIAAGDVDNDGDIDFVTAERSANRVWLNDGAGNLTLLMELEHPQFTFGMELGDLDNDGDLDLITTRRAYRNDGTGRMTHIHRWLPGVRRRSGVAIGDLDADGDLDVVIGYSMAQELGDGQPNVVHYGSGTD
ncbi:MAG: FG-GAP repeat domain-containing protein, partial [Planctomycetota bacterium]